MELQKGEVFFEKIAKFHEVMGKMDDADFGLALRYVSFMSLFLIGLGFKVSSNRSGRQDCNQEIF
jgi:hypothetical protein